MKVVILCGGKGTRLKEETEFKPKPLIKIGNKPILTHIMKRYSHYGHHQFVLPLGYKGDMIKEYFINSYWKGNDCKLCLADEDLISYSTHWVDLRWEIDFVDTGLESKTALRLYKVKHLLENDDVFMLTYGDGLADIDIDKLIRFHHKMGKIVTITGLHPRSKYGVIDVDDNGIVREFKEKPILKDFINGGFMVINKKIFDHLDDKNVMLVYDTLPKLAQMGEVAVYHHEGFWHCMDTFKDYEDLNKMWEDGKRPWATRGESK